MTDDTPPVLYISADTSDLTTRYKATPRMHMGADAWIPRNAVRVKPLEWHRDVAKSLGASWAVWKYKSPLGDRPEEWLWQSMDIAPHRSGSAGTREAAKAAAQADFEARIMSALAALPAADEGEQEEGDGE